MPEIDHPCSIEMQGFNCHSSCRSQPNNQGTVLIPDKMLIPMLLSGVVEGNDLMRHQIIAFCFRVFMVITALT